MRVVLEGPGVTSAPECLVRGRDAAVRISRGDIECVERGPLKGRAVRLELAESVVRERISDRAERRPGEETVLPLEVARKTQRDEPAGSRIKAVSVIVVRDGGTRVDAPARDPEEAVVRDADAPAHRATPSLRHQQGAIDSEAVGQRLTVACGDRLR